MDAITQKGGMERLATVLKKAYSFHIVRYTTVGAANTVAIFGLFFLFNNLIGVGPVWANRIGYVGGLMCNFTLNKIWTFKSHRFSAREIVLFLLSWGLSYGLQFAVFRILMDGLAWPEGTAAILAYPLYGLAFFLQCKYVAFNPNLGRRRTAAPVVDAPRSREAG